MARHQASPTRTDASQNSNQNEAHATGHADVQSATPDDARGPRNDAKRGHSNDKKTETEANVGSSTAASATRFMDLMRSVNVPSESMAPSTQAEDGSAEALLSLMESVRARGMQLAREDSLIVTTRSSDSSNSRAKKPTTATRARHAVHRYQDESSGGERASGDVSSDGGGGGEQTPKGRAYKKRKSTHTVRKEEKAVLLDEIKTLEDRLTFLRGQVFAPVRDDSGQVVQPGVSNAVLRQAIHEQQLRFASARSLLSQSLTSEIAAPLHTYLRLGSNMAERRAQLLAMKAETLASGKKYIEERSRMLDLTKHHAVVERFETVTGDACCIRFYVDQFPSALTSVKNVHDATSFFTSNLEMSITECLGHITIREDDDSGDPSLSQHRLVVAGTQGIIVDTNNVVFSHYNEQENYGILATTYVDEDDLHPYRPLERIRQDVTAVSLITQQDDIVVVRRWAYICMRHSPHVVFPYGVHQTIRENLGIWGDAMMQFVRERLRVKAQAQAAAMAANAAAAAVPTSL